MNALENIRNYLLNSHEIVINLKNIPEVPSELYGEDVYNTFFLFKNEEVAINFVCERYEVSRDKIHKELYEEDNLRCEYGKEKYLRYATIKNDIYLNELLDGCYILWEAY